MCPGPCHRPAVVGGCLVGTGLSLAVQASEDSEEAVPPGGRYLFSIQAGAPGESPSPFRGPGRRRTRCRLTADNTTSAGHALKRAA